MLPFAYSRHSQSELSAAGAVHADGGNNAGVDNTDVSSQVLDNEALAVTQYCSELGWPSPQWHIEKTADWRSGFCDRLTDVNQEQSLWVPSANSDIVIYSLARMFNAARDMDQTLSWMRDRDITLHVVALKAEVSQTRTITRTQVDFDYMLREMLALEVRRGAERMKRVKQKQREKGRFLGGSKPFGYMVHSNGKLIENPLEQKVLKQIHQLRQRGHSLRDIARQVSTPVAPVSFKTVQRILQRAGDSNV